MLAAPLANTIPAARQQWWSKGAGTHLVELAVLFCGTASLCPSLSPPTPHPSVPDVCLQCLSHVKQRRRAACQAPRTAENRHREGRHRAELTKFSKRHALYHRRAGARRDAPEQCGGQMPVAGIHMGPLTGRHVGTRRQSSAPAVFVLLHFTGSCYS